MKTDTCPDERSVSWKVLLPFDPNLRILALGLSIGELNGLGRTFRHVDTSPCGFKYEVLVLGEQVTGRQSDQKYLGYMATDGLLVAVGLSQVHDVFKQFPWHHVSEYACLPTHQPRIFLPLSTKRVRRRGLCFHAPGSIKQKILLFGATWLSQLGITLHLRRKTISVFSARKEGEGGGFLKSWISQQVGWQVEEMVIYAGSDSPARKITALCIPSNYNEQVVAKIADTEQAAEATRHEAEALSLLSRSGLAKSVPKLLVVSDLGPYVVQLQTCLAKGGRRSRTLSKPHFDFLSELSQINKKSIPLGQSVEWQNVCRVATTPESGEFPEAVVRLASRFVDNRTDTVFVDCHMTHGDFTSWNIICEYSSILVYDWEDWKPLGLPFQDLFHFLYRQALLVGPWPGASGLLKTMKDAALKLAREANIGFDVNCAMKLWCIKEHSTKPNQNIVECAMELESMDYE